MRHDRNRAIPWREDAAFHYSRPISSLGDWGRAMVNPSIVAARLFRWSTSSGRVRHLLARWLLLRWFSCDVAQGARFSGPINLPHPLGIVVGDGVRVGARCTLYQNVTLGKSSSGRYPTIGDDVTLFAGAVVFGGVELPAGTSVGANQVVKRAHQHA